MRDRLRARRDRVLEQCDLGELLQEYGYTVVPDRHREQQFSCDLHGPDNKPSARYYGTSNTTYCWVCQKTRDAIAYVIEKENVGFREAIEFIERRLGLEALPWSDEDGSPSSDPEPEIHFNPRTTYEREHNRLQRLLEDITRERLERKPHENGLDCNSILAFWEVFDRIDYGLAKERWSESMALEALEKLRIRVLEKIKQVEG